MGKVHAELDLPDHEVEDVALYCLAGSGKQFLTIFDLLDISLNLF